MKIRQSIFLITALAMIALLVALQQFQQHAPACRRRSPLPSSPRRPHFAPNQRPDALTANVSNDTPRPAGVTWSVTCGLPELAATLAPPTLPAARQPRIPRLQPFPPATP